MTDFEATGGCLCGAVRFRVTAKPLMAGYCHCTMCQKNGGGPFSTGATVPIEAFAFTKGEPKCPTPSEARRPFGPFSGCPPSFDVKLTFG